jgi:hypothetical protein
MVFCLYKGRRVGLFHVCEERSEGRYFMQMPAIVDLRVPTMSHYEDILRCKEKQGYKSKSLTMIYRDEILRDTCDAESWINTFKNLCKWKIYRHGKRRKITRSLLITIYNI